MSNPHEEFRELAERLYSALYGTPGQTEHDPAGEAWQRHAPGGRRDLAADAETRAAIQREQRGEYDSDGTFRPSTWKEV